MITLLKKFCRDDEGAVTVDFVILTSAVVGMGLIVGAQIHDGAVYAGEEVKQSLLDQ